MKAIQTLWCGGKSLLHESFGWATPMHHLMAWTLSSSRLFEYFDQIELYTDSEGYDMLIKKLQLPYTKAHIVLDDVPFSTSYWSLAKIKTYSLQKEPFIHFDGDVFLFQPLSGDIMNAPLLAQNREYGTSYYKNGLSNMKRDDFKLPKQFDRLIDEERTPYNMGIFGGTDIAFINKYANNVFDICRSNGIFEGNTRHLNGRYNAIIEQVFFAFYAEIYRRDVRCVLPGCLHDDDYSDERFWNIEQYSTYPFFHMLGGHKATPAVCSMMEKVLLHLYPHLYEKVAQEMCCEKEKTCNDDKKSASGSIAEYRSFFDQCRERFERISRSEVLKMDSLKGDYKISSDGDELETSEYLHLFEISGQFNDMACQILKDRLSCSKSFPLSIIAMTPTLRGSGTSEFPIVEFDLQVIKILKAYGCLAFGRLFEIMFQGQICSNPKNEAGLRKLLSDRVTALIIHGAVYKRC